MYQIGYCNHYLDLKRKYPQFKFDYPRDWTLKEYGTLFIYDLIRQSNAKRVLELGCGYETFFAKEMAEIGIEYWCIDRSNDYLGIGKDDERFRQAVAKRETYGAKVVDGLLGQNIQELPSEYFDVVFSMSVIEHIDDNAMSDVIEETRRILRAGGQSAHSIDIYPRSNKAKLWHGRCKQAGLDVPLPYYDRWEFEGNYTTFTEQPKVRFMIYNSLDYKDPLMDGANYVSQFATMLCVAVKPQ